MFVHLLLRETLWFLMHRVELKAKIKYLMTPFSKKFLMHRVELKELYVLWFLLQLKRFLMHRVELKGLSACVMLHTYPTVPNAPCGVESRYFQNFAFWKQNLFLMHRVELKVGTLSAGL